MIGVLDRVWAFQVAASATFSLIATDLPVDKTARSAKPVEPLG